MLRRGRQAGEKLRPFCRRGLRGRRPQRGHRGNPHLEPARRAAEGGEGHVKTATFGFRHADVRWDGAGGIVLSLTRSARRTLLSLVVFSLPVGACSLVVSTNSYTQGCPADKKPCESQTPGVFICVSKIDPAYGCATD